MKPCEDCSLPPAAHDSGKDCEADLEIARHEKRIDSGEHAESADRLRETWEREQDKQIGNFLPEEP